MHIHTSAVLIFGWFTKFFEFFITVADQCKYKWFTKLKKFNFSPFSTDFAIML